MTTLSKLNDYGDEFQIYIIALLQADKKFLLNTAHGIKLEHFDNPSHQWIVKTILDYFYEYRTIPPKNYMEVCFKKIEDAASVASIKLNLAKCQKATAEAVGNKEWIESEFRKFCFNQALKNAILNSAELLGKEDYDGIQTLINKVYKLKSDNTIGKDAVKDIESVLRDEDRKAIPFMSNELTRITRGGYGAGDLVLIFGSPGGGKTSLLVANAAHALKMGKNVVHYSLELSEDYTIKKYYACLIDKEIDELNDCRSELEEILKGLPGRLIVKEYSPRKESFRTIETHLQQLKDHEDFEPDMIVIDYLDYIRSHTSRAEKKDEIDDVYIQAKGLAKELGIPILSPSQANRTAASTTIIEGAAAAGSYDKLMIADIVMSMQRTKNDKNAGIGRIHIIKNRYGRDGATYLCEIDLARNYINMSEEPMTDEELENADKIPRKQMKKIEDRVQSIFDS